MGEALIAAKGFKNENSIVISLPGAFGRDLPIYCSLDPWLSNIIKNTKDNLRQWNFKNQ